MQGYYIPESDEHGPRDLAQDVAEDVFGVEKDRGVKVSIVVPPPTLPSGGT